MRKPLVITFTGPDRPGIVERLAALVAVHGGNWEQSRMATLAGRFAGILQVSVPEARTGELLGALEGLRREGLAMLVDPGDADADAGTGERVRLRLDLTGADHEGIVSQVAQVLATRGINIAELETERFIAPMSGEPLFHARARLECMPDADEAELRAALERLALDLMVTIELEPADPGAALPF